MPYRQSLSRLFVTPRDLVDRFDAAGVHDPRSFEIHHYLIGVVCHVELVQKPLNRAEEEGAVEFVDFAVALQIGAGVDSGVLPGKDQSRDDDADDHRHRQVGKDRDDRDGDKNKSVGSGHFA